MIQLNLISDITQYGFGQSKFTRVVRVLYVIIMLLYTVLRTFIPSMTPFQTYLGCIIVPPAQLQDMMTLAA